MTTEEAIKNIVVIFQSFQQIQLIATRCDLPGLADGFNRLAEALMTALHTLFAKRDARIAEFPREVGQTLWTLEVDEHGKPDDFSSWILIGGNRDYAFLSPRLGDKTGAEEICNEFYKLSMEFDDLPIAVVPWSHLYLSHEDAEEALRGGDASG